MSVAASPCEEGTPCGARWSMGSCAVWDGSRAWVSSSDILEVRLGIGRAWLCCLDCEGAGGSMSDCDRKALVPKLTRDCGIIMKGSMKFSFDKRYHSAIRNEASTSNSPFLAVYHERTF